MSPPPTDFMSPLALFFSPVLSFSEGHSIIQDFSSGSSQFRKKYFLKLDIF